MDAVVRALAHSATAAAPSLLVTTCALLWSDAGGDALADAWQDVQHLVDRLPSAGSDMSCSEGRGEDDHGRRAQGAAASPSASHM